MRGYKNIAALFKLKERGNSELGIFNWKHRMGIHLAFHRDPMNIFLHTVMPPLNALGVLMFLYPFYFFNTTIGGEPITLALLVLFASFLLYALIDVLAATLVTLPTLLLYPLCAWAYAQVGESFWLMALLGSIVFGFALWVQVGIGHKICEEGIGDEDENIAEMFETLNPIYFIVLPVYTILDLLFMLGYRKNASDLVWDIMNELRPLVVERKSNHMEGKGI